MSYPIYYEGSVSVTPAMRKSDVRIFTTIVNAESSEGAQPVVDEIIRSSRSGRLPYFSGLLEASNDGTTITPELEESREGVSDWLALLITHFFVPRNYVLSGEIAWTASDDPADRGVIYIKDNKMEIVEDSIINYGPTWDGRVSMSDRVKALLQDLLASCDCAAGAPDSCVVSATALQALQDALRKA